MKQMHDLMQNILDNGYTHDDRTGVGRRSVYNVTMDFDASKGPVIVNTQKVFVETAVKELLWMLGGHDKIDIPGIELAIWKKWCYQDGGAQHHRELIKQHLANQYGITPSDDVVDSYCEQLNRTLINSVGKMYPQAWRHAPLGSTSTLRPNREYDEIPSDIRNKFWEEQNLTAIPERDFDEQRAYEEYNLRQLNVIYWRSYDQINEMFLNMKKRPHSSRHRVSAWIPEWIPDEGMDSDFNILNNRGALTPCHSFFQFTVGKPNAEGKPTLNLFLYQGSMDVPVGGPYNLACYTVMLHIFAKLLDMAPNRFTVSIGDAHIYTNQVEQVKEQLSRKELNNDVRMRLMGKHVDPFSIKPSDIVITGYNSHEHIKYPVAV